MIDLATIRQRAESEVPIHDPFAWIEPEEVMALLDVVEAAQSIGTERLLLLADVLDKWDIERVSELTEALVESKAVIVLLFGTLGLPDRAIDAPWYARTVACLNEIDRVLPHEGWSTEGESDG